jgi:hypothetical protein
MIESYLFSYVLHMFDRNVHPDFFDSFDSICTRSPKYIYVFNYIYVLLAYFYAEVQLDACILDGTL